MSDQLVKAAKDTRSEGVMAERSDDELRSNLAQVRVVLINTTHPGNIGATARAMKVMGLSSLHLVTPKIFPNAEATAMASGADDILQRAVVHDTLDSALSGCPLVLGTSARLRSLPMPMFDARRAARQALQESGSHDVAILFGRERYGLTNEEMMRCQYLVNIPANPEYSSLNLAQAVQIMSYELRVAAMGVADISLPPLDWEPVDDQQMELMFQHLEQTLLDIRFLNPKQPKKLMMRLRRLFKRARPDQNEINILRGILKASQESASRQ
ncbi:MAG: RNA methyltransferase [Xanthomonadales bacterium]|nr:RNA methyltransferase [Xanthomonadales bacterium]